MDATNRQADARMQITSGSTQVIDDVYVLNGAICLHTFNYPMMKHGSLGSQILKRLNKMWIKTGVDGYDGAAFTTEAS